MLNAENLERFARAAQTDTENVVREYCQHLFLSFLYEQPGSERLLFKGGTALRIVLRSPRFSEDLDFTSVNIDSDDVERLFTAALADVERSGIPVEIEEGKATTGGWLGIALFQAYQLEIAVRIEVSLRRGPSIAGTRTLIHSDYLPPYTLVHLPIDGIVEGKLQALLARRKPRDFYDFFFLLSGDYPKARERDVLIAVLKLLREVRINFRAELKKFLPASQTMLLRDFPKLLEEKIRSFGVEVKG